VEAGQDPLSPSFHIRAEGLNARVTEEVDHAIKGDAERCLEAGMDAYASKPIHAAELLAAIHSLAPAGAPAPVRELTAS